MCVPTKYLEGGPQFIAIGHCQTFPNFLLHFSQVYPLGKSGVCILNWVAVVFSVGEKCQSWKEYNNHFHSGEKLSGNFFIISHNVEWPNCRLAAISVKQSEQSVAVHATVGLQFPAPVASITRVMNTGGSNPTASARMSCAYLGTEKTAEKHGLQLVPSVQEQSYHWFFYKNTNNDQFCGEN